MHLQLRCCFHFGSASSYLLKLFLHWSPVAYWALTDLGSFSFSILSFCLFILFMGGSWWRDLTECGPLEKGMANHFSILALRTLWTVWKGKMIGYWSVWKSSKIRLRILSIALRDELKVLNTVEWLNDYCFVLLDCYPLSLLGFPGGLDGKESACNAGDPGLIPGLGRSCGEGNGNPLQYSWVEDSMDKGAL